MATQTFHQFTTLPRELQNMIWSHALEAEDPSNHRLDKHNYQILFVHQWHHEFECKTGEVMDYDGHHLIVKDVSRSARLVTLQWWRRGLETLDLADWLELECEGVLEVLDEKKEEVEKRIEGDVQEKRREKVLVPKKNA